jgi:hypothetical protein
VFNLCSLASLSPLKAAVAICVGAGLAACGGDAARLTNEVGWIAEVSTLQKVCGIRFAEDARFAYACDNGVTTEGAWEQNGSVVRLMFDSGTLSSCPYSFDGTILVLGQECQFPGRFENASTWNARMNR